MGSSPACIKTWPGIFPYDLSETQRNGSENTVGRGEGHNESLITYVPLLADYKNMHSGADTKVSTVATFFIVKLS